MEMLIQKIVLNPQCREPFLAELETANERLRQARGFLSGIVLASRNNPLVIYYFSMWMDRASIRDFEAWLPHFRELHRDWIQEVVEENLEVLLSVTQEGDFRPVGDA